MQPPYNMYVLGPRYRELESPMRWPQPLRLQYKIARGKFGKEKDRLFVYVDETPIFHKGGKVGGI